MSYVGQSQVMKVWNPPTVIADETKPVSVSVRISDHPYANAPSGKVVIEEFQFEGAVVWKETAQHTECKILTLRGDNKSVAGCCVFEIPGWGLGGFTLSNANEDLRFFLVPVSSRNQKKILGIRLPA